MGSNNVVKLFKLTWVLLKVIAVAITVSLVLSLILAFTIIDQTPKLEQVAPSTVADAAGVKHLLTSLQRAYFRSGVKTELVIKEKDLNALLAVAHRGSEGQITSQADITAAGASIVMSIRLNEAYVINLTVGISSSTQGLSLEGLQAGSLYLSGQNVLILSRWLGNILLGEQQGTELINAIARVDLHQEQMSITVAPVGSLDLSRYRLFRRYFSQHPELMVSSDVVSIYYKTLYETAHRYQHESSVSLSLYLQPLFQQAALRTAAGNNPVAENHSALLALAILLGNDQIERLVGKVTVGMGSPNSIRTNNVVIANRQDLRLHFILSAALKLLSDSGISFAIGELKELMDAVQGGSGFSFVDLAADRAGIQFALLATDPKTATQFQQLMTQPQALDESYYFPDITDLMEGISDKEFNQQYEHVESKTYKAMVEEVDRRVLITPLHKSLMVK